MIKSKLRLFGWAVGLSLALGAVGVAGSVAIQNHQDPIAAHADPTTLSFAFTSMGDTGWTSSYGSHSKTFTDGTVTFSSANKQTGTITDIPVTKGQPVSFVLADSDKALGSVTFVCRQWGSKAQTITLKYSTNGGTSYSALSPSVTSSNFTLSKSDLPTGTNAVQFTFSSTDNQVGIESLSYEFAAAAAPSPIISDVSGNLPNYILPGQEGKFEFTWSGTAPTYSANGVSWSASGSALTVDQRTGAFTASSEITAKTEVTLSLTVTGNDDTVYTAENKTVYVCPHALDTSVSITRPGIKTSFIVDEQFTLKESSNSHFYVTFLDVGQVDLIDELDDLQEGSLSITIGSKAFAIGDYLTKKENNAKVSISYSYGGKSVSLAKTYDITVADKEIVDPSIDPGWYRVTDASTLAAGDHVVIVASGYNQALGTTQNNKNRSAVAITKSSGGDSLTGSLPSEVQEIVLEVGTKTGTFAFRVDTNKYLYAASSSDNLLKTGSKTDDASFAISITAAGVATLTAQGNNSRNKLQYNSSNTWFSCYSSTQQSVSLYRYSDPSLVDCIQYWANHNLHLADVGEHDATAGTDCLDYYLPAKAALKAMNDDHAGVIAKLETGTEEAVVAIRARYVSWATAKGDANPFDGNTGIASAAVVFKGVVDNARTPLLVAAFAGVGALAVGGMVFLRKRKEF